jgi:SAM-dependent methyltransferase
MLDSVAKQYSEWTYPQPSLDLREAWESADPRFQNMHYLYWPDRPYFDGIRILVVGCGTNQAARIAERNPTAQVLGIDISETSIAHERLLKERYALANLSLERMAIDQLRGFHEEFDLIIATGVIHHQADPVASLAILAKCLSSIGVIYVMVYGRYARLGVYMFQDLFRRLGLAQTSDDVKVVRESLSTVPKQHPVHPYAHLAHDLKYDAGIVDTFLHTVDHCYTVSECLDLVEQAGLRFSGWVHNFFYYPNGHLHSNHGLYKRLNALPERELWSAMELYHGSLGRHEFLCSLPCAAQRSSINELSDEQFVNLVPVRRDGRLETENPADAHAAARVVTSKGKYSLTGPQLRAFRFVDDQRSVKDCLSACGIPLEKSSFTQARDFFASLWRLDIVAFRQGG